MYIVWEWELAAVGEELQSDDNQASGSFGYDCSADLVSECSVCNTSDSEPEEAETCTTTLQHSVKFKCVGVTLDASYQTVLRRARDLRNAGVNVPVRLQPEPNNPVDSKATCIAFICEVDDKWKRIGYVVTARC